MKITNLFVNGFISPAVAGLEGLQSLNYDTV